MTARISSAFSDVALADSSIIGFNSSSPMAEHVGIMFGGAKDAAVVHAEVKKASDGTLLPICACAEARCLSTEADIAATEAACLSDTTEFAGGACESFEASAFAICWPYKQLNPNAEIAKTVRKGARLDRYEFCKEIMSSNPYLAYVESKVISASPLQLVSLAYDGAIEAISQARVHLAAKQIQERSSRITKAQLIIVELHQSLDFKRGGELAKTLAGLYDYILQLLRDGNFQQKDQPLAEAQKLLETVGQSWKELSATEATAPLPSAPSPWLNAAESAYSGSALSYSL